jgi:hypothetical protein
MPIAGLYSMPIDTGQPKETKWVLRLFSEDQTHSVLELDDYMDTTRFNIRVQAWPIMAYH